MFLPKPNLTSDANSATNTDPRRRWKKIAVWSLVGCLVIGGAFSVRPIYGSLKAQRAERIVAAAEELVGEQDWEGAYEKAQAALQLDPKNTGALRVVARALTRAGREEAFHYWKLVFAEGDAGTQDLEELVELALKLKRMDVAEPYLSAALRQVPVSTQTLRLATVFCNAKGDLPRAIEFARAYVRQEPADIDMKLLLARLLLGSGQPSLVPEAKGLLWTVVDANHPSAVNALGWIAYLPDLGTAELKRCLELFGTLPAGDVDRDLVMADLRLRLEPKRRAELIAAEVKRHGAGTPVEALSLARWLSKKQEFKMAAEVIPLEVALTRKDLFLVYVDAVASLTNWVGLETVLARESLPIEPVLAELYRARVARELKKEREMTEHWKQVHWLASKNPEALQYVAEYAEKLGDHEEAATAYKRLTRDPARGRVAWLALIRLAQKKGDGEELRSLMKELVTRFPADPAPRNDLAYLELLAGENLPGAQEVAKALVEKYPNLLAYRTTLALSYLRSDDLISAKEVYDGVNVAWSSVFPAWQAVYAAVLGANGDTVAARELAQGIAADELKPEERALVETLLVSR